MREDILHSDEPRDGLSRGRVIEGIADDVELDDAAAFFRPRRFVTRAVDVGRRHFQRRTSILVNATSATTKRIRGGGKRVSRVGIFQIGEDGSQEGRVKIA